MIHDTAWFPSHIKIEMINGDKMEMRYNEKFIIDHLYKIRILSFVFEPYPVVGEDYVDELYFIDNAPEINITEGMYIIDNRKYLTSDYNGYEGICKIYKTQTSNMIYKNYKNEYFTLDSVDSMILIQKEVN